MPEPEPITGHELFAYQRAGVDRLCHSPAVLLADDMGLGKTIQAIAALRELVRRGELNRGLIVVPVSLIAQWRLQLAEWAPELRFSTVRGNAAERALKWRAAATVYIAGYETVRADFSTNPHSPLGRTWDVVILDEAQRIKSRDSDIAATCKALPRRRVWALTGTPLENRLDDLGSILEFTRPTASEAVSGGIRAPEDILRMQAQVQLRRRKRDVLADLPPKLHDCVRLELPPAQRRAYDRAEREGIIRLRDLGVNVTITHVLELITRLKQICNFCPETGESVKLDDLDGRLALVAGAGEKALVFSQFVEEPFGIERLRKRLQHFRPLALTGAMDLDHRENVVRRFKEDPERPLLLLSLRAGGLGLNLQEATHVFHFDRWWNPATEKQAEDRAHRLGQHSTVFVHSYVCENTVEERIDAILAEKRDLFDAVVDGETGGLTPGELFRIVGIEPPVRRTT